MSNQKVAISVSLFTTLLILGYYLIRITPMLQHGGMNSEAVFRLAGVVVIATIALSIAGNILTNIVINIIHAIQTRSEKQVRMIEDERDKLFSLKGTSVSYVVFSLGVLIAMVTFVFGQPPLVMFSLIVFASLVAEICGDLIQLYFYRRGW